jgi:hypothetical protein
MSDHQPGPMAQPEILSPVPPTVDLARSHFDAPGADPLAPPPPPVDAAPEAPAPCTQAQLRRFIKSRPYVPLHELRRRFGLNGADDDVCGVEVDGQRVFIGLPERETGLLGELLRQGDVGYELLLDPTCPLVIGVFPMRPVQRP